MLQPRSMSSVQSSSAERNGTSMLTATLTPTTSADSGTIVCASMSPKKERKADKKKEKDKDKDGIDGGGEKEDGFMCLQCVTNGFATLWSTCFD
jgi:hypothetical protein